MAVRTARRMDKLGRSEIREILKLTMQPDVINFAGGLPAPELFPIEEIKGVTQDLLSRHGRQVLQYSTTEGFYPFREIIAARMNDNFHTKLAGDDIAIVTGSQQALDLAGKIFIDEGDAVLLESPSYLGAINAFKPYGPRFVEVAMDGDGMIPEELERAIRTAGRAKLLYMTPDFQNPTGRTLSLERRKHIIEIINKYNLPLIEDNPYGELRFEGERLPALKSLDSKGLVIYNGTFSKIFSPGLRVGWVAAAHDLLELFVTAKQSGDLHTSEFNQRIIYEYLLKHDIGEHIKRLAALYKSRLAAIIKSMEEEFPPGVVFTRPAGGLFLWVVLPEGADAGELLRKCLKEKVAFVPGSAFYPNGGQKNTLRLNFSNMPEDRIREGIKRMAAVFRKAAKA
ncbi:MAG: PLP-dependent aminotransferase family protein [Acidaminococcales bacterium]|jgi:DNA-binding transcriptional MocR family regulator|nr:PLP-dependent aminotransferase family protein [Acidaminococcales bacterium]